MAGLIWRTVLVAAGVVLGVAIVAGNGFWRTRPSTDVPEPLPAASVPAGSYVAPGPQG